MNEIIDAAKLAQIDLEIRKFENGYGTILGERGVTLSGGKLKNFYCKIIYKRF